MAKEGNGYIVMPPRENSLFKSEGGEGPTLDSFGVEKSEKLDVVGGYLAELNPAQVRDMKRQGYQIFKDEVKSYIPNQEKLDMNALAEDAIAKAEAAIEKGELPEASDTSEKSRSLFVPRNEMTEPRFESTIQNLATTSENLSASNSRIRDADFAAESAELARTQVLQQAGLSVLAQANARPQQVLQLLQG